MDVFENLVADILWRKGYWVRTLVSVNLSKEDKVRIGRPSSPRWQLDIVGYRCSDNTLFAIECKSYLDSAGVRSTSFDGSSQVQANYFKLFNEPGTWDVVRANLIRDFTERGLCRNDPKVVLGLACGRVRSQKDREKLAEIFAAKGWQLFDDEWVKASLHEMAEESFENNAAVMTAKLLVRSARTGS